MLQCLTDAEMFDLRAVDRAAERQHYTVYTFISIRHFPPIGRKLTLTTVKMALLTFVLSTLSADSPPLGAVARSCNPATRRQVLWDGLRKGFLLVVGSCRSGVRTKVCINMDLFGEPRRIRLTKTGRNGSGGKLSSQESLCGSVVG